MSVPSDPAPHEERFRPSVLGADGRRVDGGPESDGLPRRRRGWDILLAIALLLLAGVAGFAGAFLALVTYALRGECTGGCSEDQALAALFLAGLAVLLIVAAGVIATVVNIAARRITWWVGLATAIAVPLAWIAGFLSYGAAVGG